MMRRLSTALLGLALLAAPVTASAEWRRAESEHFVVYGRSDKAVREYVSMLEDFDALLRRHRGQARLEKPAPVPRDDDDRHVRRHADATLPAVTRLNTSIVARAVRAQVNPAARATPFTRIRSRTVSSLTTFMIADVHPAVSSG